jgi:hypothetical protein
METNNQKKFVTIALIVLLICSAGLNYYQYKFKKDIVATDETKMDSLIQLRVDISAELAQTTADLDKYKGLSSRMDSLLVEANGKISEKNKKIKQLIASEKNSEVLIKKLSIEMDELKALKDDYLETIDKLIRENKQLKQDNTALNNSLKIVMDQNINLYNKVKTGEILKIVNLDTKIFKRRNNDKYVETVLAKRTNKVEVCFDIVQNELAKEGKKEVYLRIIAPDGLPLGNRATGSAAFKKAGSEEQILYTVMQEIDYASSDTENYVCVPYEEVDRVFTSGTYVVEIYIDGYPAGASSFTLK